MNNCLNFTSKISVIAHRGQWNIQAEKNSKAAFERAFSLGFGIETDLRDIQGKIVISHDMPKGNEISFEEVLQIMNGRKLPLALNIKADGQGSEIIRLLNKYKHTNYFTFDMSLPEMVVEHNLSLNVFSGVSDILPQGIMLNKSKGVWLDSFNDDDFLISTLPRLLSENFYVCVVSPDLHGRNNNNLKVWSFIKENLINKYAGKIAVCTDLPIEAKEFFYED